ncbi:hypothetical protein J4417_01520 [Candidatus Woesearchaeota archaeon]|nr:hypothetical protein [Candidatus Woesearchaeota archaeon]
MNELEGLLKKTSDLYNSSLQSILPPMVVAALELSRTYHLEVHSKFALSSQEEIALFSGAQKMIETVASLARGQGMYAESSELYYNTGSILSALETAEEGGLTKRREGLCLEYVVFLAQHGSGSEFAKLKFGDDKKTLLGLVKTVAKKTDSSTAYSFGVNCGLEAESLIPILGEDDFCASV